MRLSASQINTYRDCKRKWGWSYILKIKGPPNASAQLGSAVHEQLETYLKGGSLDFTTEAGNIAASGLENLPKPGTPGMKIEEEFHFRGPSGHDYLGYIDVECSPESKQAKFGLPIGVVIDHKTTGDLRWQKTADDLRTDVQAQLYATQHFMEHQAAEGVELRWNYLLTKKTRKSAVTSLIVTPEQTWEQFLEIEKTAVEMAAITTTNPLDLEPTVTHCNAYGGCPYQGNCNLSPFDKLRAAAAQAKEDALNHSPKQNTENIMAVSALMARINANKAAQPTPVGMSAPVAAPVAASPAPAAINPPEWQPPPVSAEATLASMARLPDGAVPAAVPAATPVKRGPGRPRKTAPVEVTVSAVAPVAALVAAAPAHPAEERTLPMFPSPTVTPAEIVATKVLSDAVPTTPTKHKIHTLYIDCGPNHEVVDASVFVLAAKAKIRATGLADYRFADYGRGPGMLAVATAYEVEAQVGNLAAVRVDSTTPEGSAILTELIARAAVVVR